MNRQWFFVFASLLIMFSCVACRQKPGEPTAADMAFGQKVADELEKNALVFAAEVDMRMKTGYDAYVSKIYEDVRDLDSMQFHALVAYLCSKSEPDRSGFEGNIVDAVVRTLLYKDGGEREEIVFVLSRACPREVAAFPIEFLLALGGDKPFQDPILVLVESWRKSTDDKVKAMILQVLKDSFPQAVSEGQSDDAFIEQCAAWYKKNHKHLELNSDYPNQFDTPWSRRPGAPGLFIESQ